MGFSKQCTKCGEVKWWYKFGKRKRGLFNLQSSCKICVAQRSLKWTNKNSEKMKEAYRKWKDKNSGERKEKTEWHRVVVFSKGIVGVVKSYVKKGSKVYIEGALQTRKWTDKDGNDKYTTEVVLQGFNAKIILLDKKGENQGGGSSQSSNSGYSASSQEADGIDDEIPF